MAKWQHAPHPHPPTAFHRSCTTALSNMQSQRRRSGSLNDKLIAAPSPSNPSEDEQLEEEGEEEETSSRNMQLAAMAIPQFRSCRPNNNHNNNAATAASGYGEWRIRRRGRSVSDNSSSSTSSMSSSSSSNASRLSMQQLSASVSALRSGSMDSDDSMDGSMMAVGSVVVAPALPQPPYPVDPYHFYCKPQQTTGSVLSEITTLMNDCDVEYSLHSFKCKFKCVKYVHYSHVEFIVRVYTHQNALLVEFQRRSGSLLLWDGLYNILYHKLVELVDTTASACSQSGGQKKVGAIRQDSLSAQIWRTMTSQTPSSGVEAMKIMLTSKYVDAQREGCSGLAVLTEDAQSAFLVAKHDLVEPLVAAAESNDLDMARCAVGALANISKAIASFPNQEVADLTLEQMKRAAKIVIELLAKTTDTLFSLELLRECARALRSFGKICPQQVVDCEGNTQLLHHLNHRDVQLANHCREALQELQMDV